MIEACKYTSEMNDYPEWLQLLINAGKVVFENNVCKVIFEDSYESVVNENDYIAFSRQENKIFVMDELLFNASFMGVNDIN